MLGAIVLLCWAILLSAVREALPLLPKYRVFFEQQISSALHLTISFDEVNVSWYHLQPEISVTQLNVWGKNHQSLMKIPEVDLRLSILSSLLSRQLEFSLIQVKSWQLHVYQTPDKTWQIAGIESVANPDHKEDVTLSQLFSAILAIKQLQLTDAFISLQPLNEKNIQLQLTEMVWSVDGETLKIYGVANLRKPGQGKLNFAAHLTSDWREDFAKKMIGQLYVKFSPMDPQVWLGKSTTSSYGWQNGLIDGEVWADWQKDHWQTAMADLNLQHLSLAHQTKNYSLFSWQAPLTSLRLWWQAGDSQHHVQFDLKSDEAGNLQLGKIFRTSMPYQQLDAQGQWDMNAGVQRMRIPYVRFRTEDAEVLAQLHLDWSATQAMQMTLLSRVHFNNVNHVSTYLPAGIMPASVVDWLDHGILGGKALDAHMLWHGALAKFPFEDHSGTMQIFGKVQDASIDYAPGWPTISHLNADLYFTSHGMHIEATQGNIGNIPIKNVSVDLPSYSAPHLLIVGYLQDQLQTAWSFLNHSPLQKTLASLLTQLQAEGPFNLKLKLAIPLGEEDDVVQYQGDLTLANDLFSLTALPIQLDHAQGQLSFDQDHVHGQLSTQWLQQVWTLHADSQPGAAGVQLSAQGKVPLEAWMKVNYPTWSDNVEGSTDAQVIAQIPSEPNGPFHLSVDSSLQGIRLHNLLGLSKEPDNLTPLHFEMSSHASSGLQSRLQWQSPQGNVSVQRNRAQWQFVAPLAAGQIISATDAMPLWQINLRYLDLRQLSDDMSSSFDADEILPAINFQANHVTLPDKVFNKVAVKLRPTAHGMLIQDLLLDHAKFQVTAQGAWVIQKNGSVQTHIQGQLNTANLGDTLESLHLPKLVDTSKSQVNFNLRWPGALWAIDRKAMFGQLQLKTGQGMFTDVSSQTNAKIDLGRLLNILSISSLTSHFTSNFTDLKKGFAFDQLDGDLNLLPGAINPIDININGQVANVELTGCVDQAKERLHLIAQIKPKLTSSLPVIATIAGGPIVGAFGFLADKLLSPAVGQIGSSHYLIEGSFHNPQTKEINQLQAKSYLQVCRR